MGMGGDVTSVDLKYEERIAALQARQSELEALKRDLEAQNSEIEMRVIQLAARVVKLEALNVDRIAAINRMAALDEQRIQDYNDLHRINEALQLLARGKEMGDGPPVVVVNSLPKSGSQTISHSLEAATNRLTVYHHHAVSDRGISDLYKDTLDLMRDTSVSNWVKYSWARLEKLKQTLVIRQDILNEMTRADGRRAFFISGVREPVSFFLSYVFQLRIENDVSETGQEYISIPRLVDMLQDFYGEPYKPLVQYLPEPSRWIEREIVEFHGVDPSAVGFDQARGYQVYEGRLGKVLLFRVEDLSRIFDSALKDLLGPLADGVQRRDVNTASDKAYLADYKSTVAKFKVPAALLDHIYSSSYARTFYSDKEIADFRAKWIEP